MKRLYYFSIRSFAGPFLVTFAISMFILIMQFFWKYIDDLMGKGLDSTVILELLFYVSASLIPLALPLAILLSSIMTLGNLAENNELTALKSSGLSLYKILRPLFLVVFIIALSTFFFANYVIPVANKKLHSLIYDIQQTKIASVITPGAFSRELDGYAIKVDQGDDDEFKGVLILDQTNPIRIRTIRAETGKIYKSENGKYLFFELRDGNIMEELSPQPPNYSDDGMLHNASSTRPAQRSSFEQATYKIDLSGFDLSRSDEDLFKDKHEMLNVFQINTALDSMQRNARDILNNFVLSLKNDHPYFLSIAYQGNAEQLKNQSVEDVRQLTENIPTEVIDFKKLSKAEKISAISVAQTNLRNKSKNIDGQETFIASLERDMDNFLIEFHRKFALTVAIIVLFFVGAPLGAIVKKGGFGAPVVIAALLFMVYFVLITVGDNAAKAGSVSPFIGMWFSTLVLAPIAVWLMHSAAIDAPVFRFLKFRKPSILKSKSRESSIDHA